MVIDTVSAASVHRIATGATLNLAGFDQGIAGLHDSGMAQFGAVPGTILTITGPCVGHGGELAISVDATGSDRLRLTGAAAVASESTTVRVTHLDALRAPATGEGVEVIGTGNGGAPGARSLCAGRRPCDVGACEYRLHRAPQCVKLKSSCRAAMGGLSQPPACAGKPVGDQGPQPACIERGGSALCLRQSRQIEPQAQLIHRQLSLDDTALSRATVKHKTPSDWTLRLGARIKGSMMTSAGVFKPYGSANICKSTGSNDSARSVAPAVTSDIETQGGHISTALAVGATLEVNQRTSFYGELSRHWAHGGNAEVKSGVQARRGGESALVTTWPAAGRCHRSHNNLSRGRHKTFLKSRTSQFFPT